MIRAAAKNYQDVVIIPSKDQYASFLSIIETITQQQQLRSVKTSQEMHLMFLLITILISLTTSTKEKRKYLNKVLPNAKELRYGENPHQKGIFHGDMDAIFDKLHGKELSYNNLLDVDAAVNLMAEFKNDDPTFAILSITTHVD